MENEAIMQSVTAERDDSVGREYRVPQSEIGKYLVSSDLKDPRNVDWSELMRYAPVVAPIDPPTGR